MSTTKVSELSAKTSLGGGEELLISDSGTSKKVTATNLLAGAVVGTGDITTAKIANDAVTEAKLNLISTSSVPSLEAKGDGSSQDGYIQLNCSQNSHGIKLKSPPHSANASYTLTFPNNDGDANQKLTTNGSGVLTWTADTDTVYTHPNHSGDVTSTADGATVIGNNKVVTAMILDDNVTADKLANSINTAIAANTAKTTNATHSGEVTGATALTIADNIVDEANLKVSNSPTNGYVLTAQSGNTGGMTWAEIQSGNTTANGLWEHAHTIASNYSITSGNNAIAAGPITINSGVSVTVPTGSTWVVA